MRSLGTTLLSVCGAAFAGFACAQGNASSSNPDPSSVQSSGYFEPIRQIGVYLDGFHVMKKAPDLFLEAHHYCAAKGDDLLQCAIFDGNTSDANLVGIEYVVSEHVFDQLPAEEKEFWHPHDYEILAGQLVAPGMQESEEKALMKKWMNSYGKTWHLWNTGYFGRPQADSVPLGVPMLAWSFNADGEAPARMVVDRDQRFGMSTEQRRTDRADLRSLAQPQEGVNDLAPFFPNRHVPDWIEAK
jgi:hypothetical protein